MSIFKRLKAWWSKDDLETADEETRMTEADRAEAERDYQAARDDTAVSSGRLAGGSADYESDSERPH